MAQLPCHSNVAPLAAVFASALLLSLAGCSQDSQSPEITETSPTLATAVTPLSFRQVSSAADQNRTCGVTTDNRAYCWGGGWLGNGSNSMSVRPAAVAGGLQFQSVSSGFNFSCGVTTDFRVYCWGVNLSGQLGDGTRDNRLIPVRVLGTRQYRQVSAGNHHACALTRDNRAFCWGENNTGMLGNGTVTPSNSPVPVSGGHSFRSLTTGSGHSCGVTPTNKAFCWGNNAQGEVGDGSTAARRLVPSLVAGDRNYLTVTAGFDHTCGVTVLNRGFCWGNGRDGQVGDGKRLLRFTPRAVAGGLSLERITAGVFHTCAETTSNRAYCWGANTFGALGIGEAGDPQLTPVAVTGGHFFSQVSAGAFHTCGISSDNKAFCWGYNFGGALGDGTRDDRWEPTAVLGPI